MPADIHHTGRKWLVLISGGMLAVLRLRIPLLSKDTLLRIVNIFPVQYADKFSHRGSSVMCIITPN